MLQISETVSQGVPFPSHDDALADADSFGNLECTGCQGFWCLPCLYGRNVAKSRQSGCCAPCLLYGLCPFLACWFAGYHRYLSSSPYPCVNMNLLHLSQTMIHRHLSLLIRLRLLTHTRLAHRSQMRDKYKLHEAPCSDCCVHLCCSPLGVCQEVHEAKQRGLGTKCTPNSTSLTAATVPDKQIIADSSQKIKAGRARQE